jgi:hypothetical protein
MATDALDFSISCPFHCIFRTTDVSEQVMDLLPSKDGEHLFILTKKGSSAAFSYHIYRLSGLNTYRSPVEINISKTIKDKASAEGWDNDDYALSVAVLANLPFVDVLGIALNPQDSNVLVYVTNVEGDRVNAITNALTATDPLSAIIEQKEGTGLPPAIAVYTAVVEMNNPEIAYIGTEEGIYRTTNFASPSPVWDLYNNGINAKVPVFKLYQQTNLVHGATSVTYNAQGKPISVNFTGVKNYGIIYAATHGLGVFVDSMYWNSIPDAPFYGTTPNSISLHVFPNPVQTAVTVDFTITNTTDVRIVLSDVVGRTVMTKPLGTRMIGNYQESIDCSALSEGIYFVTVNAGYRNQSAKIVIRK